MNLGAVELLILMMIVLVPLVIVGLVVGLGRRNRAGGFHPSPLDTLEGRFARGELSQADFEQQRAALLGQASPPDGFA